MSFHLTPCIHAVIWQNRENGERFGIPIDCLCILNRCKWWNWNTAGGLYSKCHIDQTRWAHSRNNPHPLCTPLNFTVPPPPFSEERSGGGCSLAVEFCFQATERVQPKTLSLEDSCFWWRCQNLTDLKVKKRKEGRNLNRVSREDFEKCLNSTRTMYQRNYIGSSFVGNYARHQRCQTSRIVFSSN